MKPTVLLDYEFTVSASSYAVRALIKLEGKAPESSGTRVPLNLSLVLDRSGSMAGEKLAAARAAAALLVRRLDPGDTVSVVAFDDSVQTVALPATGAEAHAELPLKIAAIEAGGSTNLSGGWLMGREYVAAGQCEGATNRVLLLTDGQANVGLTEPLALTGLCQHAKSQGITTTTIGFGAGYDEHLLRAMAEAGGGGMHYIEHVDQAASVFAEEIEGLLSLAAQNVAVRVTPGAAVELVTAHHRYPCQSLADGMRFELGDLYAREPKLLLLEFLVPEAALAAATGAPIAECTVSAHVLTNAGGVEKQEVTLSIVHPLSREGHVEPEVRREMLLLGGARAREEALRAREQGDYDTARSVLRQACSHFVRSGLDGDATVAEEMADLQLMMERLDPAVFDAADAKYMMQRAYNAGTSRKLQSEHISRSRRAREDRNGPDGAA